MGYFMCDADPGFAGNGCFIGEFTELFVASSIKSPSCLQHFRTFFFVSGVDVQDGYGVDVLWR